MGLASAADPAALAPRAFSTPPTDVTGNGLGSVSLSFTTGALADNTANLAALATGQVWLARAALTPANVRSRLRFDNDTTAIGTVIDNASFQNTALSGRLVVRSEAPRALRPGFV